MSASSKPTVAISDEIFDCLADLPQKAIHKAKKFIVNFKQDPTSRAINYEKIHNARDGNFRSVRIDDNYRGIVLAPEKGRLYVLLWIAKHDDAYRWAESKAAKINPETGSLQVFAADNVEAVSTPATERPEPGMFDALRDRQLVRLGVPQDLVPFVRGFKSEADLENAEGNLPREAYDGLYCIAAGFTYEQAIEEVGGTESTPSVEENDFEAALKSDESRRKYWVVDDEEELLAMLDAPLEKWRVYLHPSQRKLVERSWNGPARVLGGAGTGKTVAAMHRAKWLARNWKADSAQKILFTTFSSNLAADIRENLRSICDSETLAKIEVVNIDAWVRRFLKDNGESRRIVFAESEESDSCWKEILGSGADQAGLTESFIRDEWQSVVQSHSICEERDYLRVSRRGRGTPLDRRKRKVLWKLFETYRAHLDDDGFIEAQDAYRIAREAIELRRHALPPYRAIIVDEAQDIEPSAYKMLRALIPEPQDEPDQNSMFIVGDGYQRIYGRRVTLSQCGINIRGRGRKLRISYRTPEEIRKWAVSILAGLDVDDLDNEPDRLDGFRSLFHGPVPEALHFPSEAEEFEGLLSWIQKTEGLGIDLKNICVIARENSQIKSLKDFLGDKGVESHVLRRKVTDDREKPGVRLATMHRAKGLEFTAVAIAGMNKGKVPSSTALQNAPDEVGREEIMGMEKMLVYVAATRARKRLLVTSSGERSEILI